MADTRIVPPEPFLEVHGAINAPMALLVFTPRADASCSGGYSLPITSEVESIMGTFRNLLW